MPGWAVEECGQGGWNPSLGYQAPTTDFYKLVVLQLRHTLHQPLVGSWQGHNFSGGQSLAPQDECPHCPSPQCTLLPLSL